MASGMVSFSEALTFRMKEGRVGNGEGAGWEIGFERNPLTVSWEGKPGRTTQYGGYSIYYGVGDGLKQKISTAASCQSALHYRER